MSNAKQVPEKWRSEDLREQRKSRLAGMKSKDGAKKPITNRRPTGWVVPVIILVVALIIVGAWASIRLGLVQQNVTAMTVNGEAIKGVEVNYYYHALLGNYGIDPTTSDGQTTLKSNSGVDGYPTVADYLKNAACQQVQQVVMLAAKAAENGLALTADDQKSIDSSIEAIKTNAQKAGVDLGNYLISQYGVGMKLDTLRAIFERSTLAGKFDTQKQESLTFTDDEIENYYKDNKDTYDVVDYRIFTINSTVATDDTDANKTKGLEEARTKANEMLAKITDGASFKALCIEYAADSDKESYKTGDKSLLSDKYKSDISSDYTSWLFDASRKTGDKTLIDATNGYTILFFAGRNRADAEHISVRHILFLAKKATATTEEIAAAKTKAEDILAQFKAGEQTEDAFAALAKAKSEDTGSASNGGLYSDVYPGEMVQEFDAWCFDSSRKTGDTAIVQTDYGFHVMYFVSKNGPEWKIKVRSALKSNAYSTYLEAELKKYPFTTNSFGMRFIA
jgi:parvulin-like peptidyl-prolyl isomerase